MGISGIIKLMFPTQQQQLSDNWLDEAHTCQLATASPLQTTASKLLKVCELGTSSLAAMCMDTAPVHRGQLQSVVFSLLDS